MRILVHEFGGYPFPVELSRELARRGHRVTHSWCASLIDTAGSAAELADRDDNPPELDFAPLELDRPLDKYRYMRRFRQERRYGRMASELTDRVRPDVVLAADVPLDGQRILLARCLEAGIPFVFWVQDLIGIGTRDLLSTRLGSFGRLVGRHYMRVEARLLRRSSAIVPITEDFRPFIERSGVDPARITTVENWAPLSELPARPKENPWARAEGLSGRFVFAYTGAIGMKQDREILLELAARYREREEVRILVTSGGPELEYLRARARELDLPNLILHGFVPWSQVPDVMGSADVLIASIHRDAGAYSVPSKVLSYLCAARPLLVSVSAQNLAGRLVTRADAGLVVEPGAVDSLLGAADRLMGSPEERERMGANARRFAESAFAIGPIADRFERVLAQALG